MAIQIIDIKQVPPVTSTTASVSVKFKILGSPPDLVQIYASRSREGWDLVDGVEVEPNRQDYENVLTLLAGAFYTIHVCPRTLSNGVLDDYIEGVSWESYCQVGRITTVAHEEQTPPPPPKPVATITSVETFPATLKRKNQIKIAWSSVKYEYFIVKWNADNDSPILRRLYQQQGGFDRNKYALLHDQVDIEREGRSGSFTLDGAVPELKYTFIVKGCDTDIFGTSQCAGWSSPKEVIAQKNLSSVRHFLQLSDQELTLGIRRHLPATSTSLRLFMQLI